MGCGCKERREAMARLAEKAKARTAIFLRNARARLRRAPTPSKATR